MKIEEGKRVDRHERKREEKAKSVTNGPLRVEPNQTASAGWHGNGHSLPPSLIT